MPALVVAAALSAAPASAVEPSTSGQTGLVHMPDARVEPEGTLRFGVSHADPYDTVWSSVSLFTRLEVSARYTRIDGVPAFPEAPSLGNYRDKAFDAKLIAVTESQWLPAVAVGAQDFAGTRLFSAEYLALGKRVGSFDITLGYGRDRIDGAFGGVRYTPASAPRWSFTAEYDAYDYRNDFRADLSGAAHRGGAAYALGYRAPWWGAQLGYQRGEVSGNVYLAVPLMEREFVPKLDEPPPYTAVTPRAGGREWGADPRYVRTLARALEQQGFTDIAIRWDGRALDIALGHDRIVFASRAVGRAARTGLRLGPADMASLRITYVEREQPLVTYTFKDLATLERYFAGHASRTELAARSEIAYASASIARDFAGAHEFVLDDEDAWTLPLPGEFVAPQRPRAATADWTFHPFNARLFFNDPGEPLRYDTFASAGYRRRLAHGWVAAGSLRLTLFENVSDIRQPSTSLLPHVRSDIGEYRRLGDDLRLDSLLLHKYGLLRERVYGRWSLGYYEEMYAGTGAQVLYLPARGDWALDVAVDALRQRAPGEAFGFRDYSVITGLASLHYRWPRQGITATARAGRFLAKDEGVRLELKRRFGSGVTLGAWYTWTNKKDITNPGSPDDPYRDKGVFVSIPLNILLTRDTRERAHFVLADYTRDVGQMVAAPDDLYRVFEHPLALDRSGHDALTDFAE